MLCCPCCAAMHMLCCDAMHCGVLCIMSDKLRPATLCPAQVKDFVSAIVNRRNSITGVLFKDDPTIFRCEGQALAAGRKACCSKCMQHWTACHSRPAECRPQESCAPLSLWPAAGTCSTSRAASTAGQRRWTAGSAKSRPTSRCKQGGWAAGQEECMQPVHLPASLPACVRAGRCSHAAMQHFFAHPAALRCACYAVLCCAVPSERGSKPSGDHGRGGLL